MGGARGAPCLGRGVEGRAFLRGVHQVVGVAAHAADGAAERAGEAADDGEDGEEDEEDRVLRALFVVRWCGVVYGWMSCPSWVCGTHKNAMRKKKKDGLCALVRATV